MKTFSYLIVLMALLLSCQADKKSPINSGHTEAETPEARLGELSFTASGDKEAQPYFKKGLLLLHSFQYEDSREEFKKARKIDPAFVMAYWGEAMTYNKPLWRIQSTEEARSVLAELAEDPIARASKARTEIERDLLAAVEKLYGQGEKIDRDRAYSEYMGKLNEKYPDQHEIAAFYALSLLGAVPVGRDEEVYGRSARIAQSILEENPNHPGALHYLIHSYDDPAHARLAKNAADRYSQVAPAAAHALHMPSHIYVALGRWDDVVNSNTAAYQASVDRMVRKGLDTDARDYHSFYWLQYGLHQKGKHAQSEEIVRQMKDFVEEVPSRNARSYLVAMKGTYLAETGEWLHPIKNIEVETGDLNIIDRAKYRFINARVAREQGKTGTVRKEIEELEKEIYTAKQLVTDRGVAMCGNGGFDPTLPNRQDVAEADIHLRQMKALLAMLEGKDGEVESHLEGAVGLESSISYSYGPPVITVPATEMYAAWLLGKGDYQQADRLAGLALERGPNRIRALEIRVEAKERTGNEEKAGQIRRSIRDIQS